MANIFAGSEIVEVGIQIEKNGKDFYEALTGQSKSEKSREIFKFLAEQEEQHIHVFQDILKAVHQYEPPESYPGEYFAYMKALASEHIFTKENKGKEIAGTVKTDAEAIDLGIKFEKESILFYEGMKKVVPENQIKPVDALIAQENNHLLKLYNIKETLK